MRIRYLILNLLYNNGAKSKILSLSLKGIQDSLASEGDSYVYKTIYNKLGELLKLGHIAEGARMGNAKTFYITTAGIEWIKDMEKESEEVLEDGE